MDKYLLLAQMTLEQQMNYVGDKEANKAVERSIKQKFLVEEKQLLPREDAAVFVGDKQLTSDLSRAIRLEASREKAKEFLINECKWSSEQFDEIDWHLLDTTLKKNQMATRCGYPSSTQAFATLDSRFATTEDSKGSKLGVPTAGAQKRQLISAFVQARAGPSCCWTQ